MTKDEFIKLKSKYSTLSIELFSRNKSDPDSKFITISTNSNHICICNDYFIYSYGNLTDECVGYKYEDYGDTWHFVEIE